MSIVFWGLRAAAVIGTILLSVVVIAIVCLAIVRVQTSGAQAISSPQGIDILESPHINGVPQWVQIRGQDKRNPVIVFIHGGPLNPMMPWGHLFQRDWERHFTVVQWDQRGVGKSRRDPASGKPIQRGRTVQQYVDDAVAVIAFVQKKTGQRQVIVMGHSWGSIIGLRLAAQHPGLLSAYVGTGQLLDFAQSVYKTYTLTREAAEAANNTKAIEELDALAPYPERLFDENERHSRLKAFLTAQKWSAALLRNGEMSMLQLVSAPFYSPAYSWKEAFEFIRDTQNMNVINEPMFSEVFRLKFSDTEFSPSVPLFFIEGTNDHYTQSAVVATNFAKIDTPCKKLFWLKGAGHFGMIEKKQEFLKILINSVRPFGTRDGSTLTRACQ